MRTTFPIRTAALLGVVGAAALTAVLGASTQKFLPDDPLPVERDTENASGVARYEPNLIVDFVYNTLTMKRRPQSGHAKNVNTIDEVPDSSWYTNRRALTVDAVANGPDTTTGPAAGTWTVTSSKSDGVTPGFTIKDASGQRWFLKFDPPGFPGMATGTEVTVTKLMWALGYNVPENHIAYLDREQLVVGSNAKFTPAGAQARAMRAGDIDKLLQRADRRADGTYRVVASKALEGTPIGRIRFEGTRSDDPNDIVDHEDRRELRAYGTFAAWLNHVDAKGINSLDTLIAVEGRSIVKHHLIDFGSALGSGATEAAEYWSGSEYLIDPHVGGRMLGFGFAQPKYASTKFYENRAIGRLPLDNSNFDPEQWKPREPNRAFLQARLDDKFWAAQRLAAISTDMIRAAVKAGEFGDADAEAFLVRALAERRDAILRAYLPAINPIADPVLSADGTLTFRNAAVDADMARIPSEYRATWFVFDNDTNSSRFVADTIGVEPRFAMPADDSLAAASFVKVRLSATSDIHASWTRPVDAYFQRTIDGWRLVGFERLADPAFDVVVTTD